MNKTKVTEYQRIYLIESLPEPLTPASSHLQIFDNYIASTRMRVRSERTPETKAWQWRLQQIVWPDTDSNLSREISEIELNESEQAVLEIFDGTEIRKNRYYLEIEGHMFEFDVYLGPLWGLNRAAVRLPSAAAANEFAGRVQDYLDVTEDPFFRDEVLVHHDFAKVQEAVSKLVGGRSDVA